MPIIYVRLFDAEGGTCGMTWHKTRDDAEAMFQRKMKHAGEHVDLIEVYEKDTLNMHADAYRNRDGSWTVKRWR